MDSYSLSRAWFNWSFSNPEKVSPNHSAIYFFAIEHCNRLGWKKNFGFPTSMAMEAIGIKSYNTYIKSFEDLVNWGFIKLIEKSKNQWSSNIIALSENDKAPDKALDKALIKHLTKHERKQHESTSESISSIDKPLTINKEQGTRNKEQYNSAEKVSASYKPCLDFYFDWHEKKIGIKPQFDGSDGKALKAIIKYFETLEAGEENINKNFRAIFSNFEKWDKFHQGQSRLRQVNSNLTNIINTLKNGKSNSKATLSGIAEEMGKRNYE